MNKYIGITYPKFLSGKLVHKLWKRFMCSRHRHLFDEVWSPDDHYLYCDACGIEVHIKKILEIGVSMTNIAAANKVFCRDCNHVCRPNVTLGPTGIGPNPTQVSCTHPSNRKETSNPTWYTPNITIEYIKEPSELNANNDCPNWKGNTVLKLGTKVLNNPTPPCIGNTNIGKNALKSNSTRSVGPNLGLGNKALVGVKPCKNIK